MAEVAVAIGVHLAGEVGGVVEVVGGVHSVSTFTLSLLRFRISFVSYCHDNDRVFITIVDLSGPTLPVCSNSKGFPTDPTRTGA